MEVLFLKKVHFYILSLIIAIICLAGCKVQTVEQYNQQNTDEKSVEGSSEKVIPINGDKEKEKVTDKKNIETEKQVNKQEDSKKLDSKETIKLPDESSQKEKTQKATQRANESDTSEKERSSISKSKNQEKPEKKEKVNKKKTVTSPNKETSSFKKTNPSKSTTESKVADKNVVKEKKKYVTISVRADTLLKPEHFAKLDKPLQSEKYVPKNGVIIATSKYEILSKDDTAWSITLRALKEHNIQFEYEGAGENKYGSVYIQGINHLYEKDAGALSGWMYSVNGKNPGLGSSSYTVKDGDQIIWQYTVDLGKDIGL